MHSSLREAAKNSFLSGPTTKRGGGKGCATKEKRTFLNMALLAQKLWRNIFLTEKEEKKKKSSYGH